MALEEQTEILWEARHEVRKAKAQIELSLARYDNRKGFCRYLANKRKTGDNVGLCWKETRDVATLDMEKA